MPPGGAKSIIESGFLDDVDYIFGAHVLPIDPVGVIGYRSEYAMAGRSFFTLKIEGRGGHGSAPHLAIDPIVAGSYFVTAVQTIISRQINPFEMGVITIGSFDGVGAFNVIPDSVELKGDVRYMKDMTHQRLKNGIERIAGGIEALYGVHCFLEYIDDYPSLYNHPDVITKVVSILQHMEDSDIKEVLEYPFFSGSEDFAYYLEKIPGCFLFIGCKPKGVEKPYYNHHPKFDIDEDCMLVAAKAMGEIVFMYLKEGMLGDRWN